MREFSVGRNDANQRLDRFCAKTARNLPASLLQKYLRQKDIKINGHPAKGDVRLAEGDIVRMYVPEEYFEAANMRSAPTRSSSPKPDVIYEDGNILLANKPAGLLCHSAGEWSANTLIAGIQEYLRNRGEWDPSAENSFAPALCNRIDRNTAGLVLAAKNAEALRILDEKIRARELEKSYLCAVMGSPKPASGRLEGYIFKDAKKNQVYVYDEPRTGAKSAVTEYKVLAREGNLSLVQVHLITGRTHQIRAQFRHAGWPLLGDGKYGSERENRAYHESKQALCAFRLQFAFPTDAGALNYLKGRIFEAPLPEWVEKYFPSGWKTV